MEFHSQVTEFLTKKMADLEMNEEEFRKAQAEEEQEDKAEEIASTSGVNEGAKKNFRGRGLDDVPMFPLDDDVDHEEVIENYAFGDTENLWNPNGMIRDQETGKVLKASHVSGMIFPISVDEDKPIWIHPAKQQFCTMCTKPAYIHPVYFCRNCYSYVHLTCQSKTYRDVYFPMTKKILDVFCEEKFRLYVIKCTVCSPNSVAPLTYGLFENELRNGKNFRQACSKLNLEPTIVMEFMQAVHREERQKLISNLNELTRTAQEDPYLRREFEISEIVSASQESRSTVPDMSDPFDPPILPKNLSKLKKKPPELNRVEPNFPSGFEKESQISSSAGNPQLNRSTHIGGFHVDQPNFRPQRSEDPGPTSSRAQSNQDLLTDMVRQNQVLMSGLMEMMKKQSEQSQNASVLGNTSTPVGDPWRRRSGIELNKVNLPKFNGDITGWRNWWSVFREAVHNNSDYSDQFKILQLFNSLEGKPLSLLNGVEKIGENYNKAIDLLKSRFGNEKIQKEKILLKLCNFPITIQEDNVTSMYKFHDTLKELGWNLSVIKC